jgi:Ca-activated chloride channel family protein
MVMLVVALARPQLGRDEFRIRTEGIAIAMCLDRSGSMRALDFPVEGRNVNRLEAVKKVFRDFVSGSGSFSGRQDDLIGLVAFGGFAESKCPPTLDHGTLLEILETVKLPEPILDQRGKVINERLLQEEQATAIGDALTVAVDRLKDLKTKSKVIVLLSDGESNAGVVQPLDAAEVATTFGIKIYAIGVGSTGMAPFPAVDPFGREVLQSQMVRLDEDALRAIAEKSNGKYFNAQDTNALRDVYAQIDQLEKTETEGRVYTEYREIYQWLMIPGLVAVLMELVLMATRFRSIP